MTAGLEALRERALRRLANPPVTGIHDWLFSCAASMHEAGFHASEKLVLLKEHCRNLRRPVPEIEIAKAITDAERKCAGKWPGAITPSNEPIIVAPPVPAWPRPNYGRVYTLAREGIGLYDLWERSPSRFDDDAYHAEEIVDAVFPGNPLLCAGIESWEFATRRRETWRGHLSRFQFIVPNPMTSVHALTAAGKLSEHAKAAVAAKVYQVCEFDISAYANDGVSLTPWAPIIRAWDENGITVADACAALIDVLRRILPLVLVVHSGGKSLHAWFNVAALGEAPVKTFMHEAVRLAADKKTFPAHQFVRMPGGTRDNGNHQIVWFFDPREAIQL
jgi:hypothetical protein